MGFVGVSVLCSLVVVVSDVVFWFGVDVVVIMCCVYDLIMYCVLCRLYLWFGSSSKVVVKVVGNVVVMVISYVLFGRGVVIVVVLIFSVIRLLVIGLFVCSSVWL